MPPIDHDNLPEQLQRDLHRLLPSLPPDLADHERGMLNQAHIALNHQHGRRTGWHWLAATSAVAAMLLVAVTIVHTVNTPTSARPTPVASARRPTIIDAMIAARRPGAKQAEIDRIAIAAVTLDSPEVRR